MIIGVDEKNNIISINNPNDQEAFSIKVIEEQEFDLVKCNYKYNMGKVINLGLKPEFAMTEEEKILKELEVLDLTINRATEDLYNLTNTTPYKSTQEVIDRKEVLRARLKELNR